MNAFIILKSSTPNSPTVNFWEIFERCKLNIWIKFVDETLIYVQMKFLATLKKHEENWTIQVLGAIFVVP